jgi:manganese/zinc/iron transport system permease protein
LFGIVTAFFVVGDIHSPWLIAAAALTGLLNVALVELLHRTQLVKEDAAIGIVFPMLFSIGVILISVFARNVHLDIDAVLLGELAFAPFERLTMFGVDLGPKSLVLMGGILTLSIVFIFLFFKELKLSTFDEALAAALGFSPVILHYALMGLVSLTAVGAFDAVGTILVVALMIAPPATAYLLTDRLSTMLWLSASIGALSSAAGLSVALWLDASIAGAMAGMAGVVFFLVFMFAPDKGFVAAWQRRKSQRWTFAQAMLAIHLLNHEGTARVLDESRIRHLHDHFRWESEFAEKVVRRSVRDEFVTSDQEHLTLTALGRNFARKNLIENTPGTVAPPE